MVFAILTVVSGSIYTEDREEYLLQACLKLVDEMSSAAGKQKNVSSTIKNRLLKLREHLKELGIILMELPYSVPSAKRERTEYSPEAASQAPEKKQKCNQDYGFTIVKQKKHRKDVKKLTRNQRHSLQ